LKAILKELRAAAGPDCAIYYRPGNHEDRAVRTKMRAFRGLAEYGWAHWLGLDELAIKWVDYEQTLEVGARVDGVAPLTAIHGHLCRKGAAQTVRGHINDHGFYNVAIGHIHRLGLTCKRHRERVIWGMECGGFFDRKQLTYMRTPDWQNGFGLVTIDPHTGHSFPAPILMAPDGSFAHGGKVYGTRLR